MLDPLMVGVGIGLLGSVAAGPAVVYGLRSVPQRWRRRTEWLLIASAVVVALVSRLAHVSCGKKPCVRRRVG